MVSKNLRRKKCGKLHNYVFIVLIIIYFTGLSVGCHFIYSNKETMSFIGNISYNSFVGSYVFLILAAVLKYSGVLNGLLYIIPLFAGIQNSIMFYKYSYSSGAKSGYYIFIDILKDTSVVLLLIMYIVLIICQIINDKYNTKKDTRYLIMYFTAVSAVNILSAVFSRITF